MLEVLKNNKHQELRMRRIYLALLGGFSHTIACLLLWHSGWFRASTDVFILMFSVIWVVNLLFPVLVLTGLNKQFADPSLTLIMVLWSQVVVMFTLYFIDEYRSFMLLFAILGIAFSAFRLETKQAIYAALFSVTLYLIVLSLLYRNHPQVINPLAEWMVGFSYAFIAICTAIVASEINAMRRRLTQKTLELQSSLNFLQAGEDVDELTGLKNRLYITNILEQQRNITERKLDYHFSVVLFEIDFFNKINEEHGYSAGEIILKYFSTQFESQRRKTDYLAKMEDGEFIFVCPFTELEQASILAERIRSVLITKDLNTVLPKLSLSISAGIASYQRPETIETLLKRVVKALYRARKQGRNQIVGL